MTPERWQQVKRVFEDAAALDAGRRSAFLDGACAGDPELRAEVESLFESEERDVSIVDGNLFDVFGKILARGVEDDREGLVLGHYRILQEIGRGGMAAVYAAVRADEEFDREVAIKLIRRGMASGSMVARFRQERQILARLDHIHIAKLFDGGLTPEGLPYLVMEKIDGEPIDVYCDRRRLSIDERLALFHLVCRAVHYAHRNLVIHRDLKPSNILVTSDGTPKLLDFGIAKLIEADEADRGLELTLDGPRPMTPEYASPEQVRGLPVTTASDVYALGGLLYRLLTGRRPYLLAGKSAREIERVVCEEDPERPSTVAARRSDDEPAPAELGRRRGATPGELGRRLRGDLDNIVMMAMEKEPERRYDSAEQLAEDVRRYLEKLPVRAHESTFAYRARKFVRRHRIGVAATLLVFLSLVAGIVATSWQMREAERERLKAESVSGFLVDLFKLSDPEKARGRDIPVRTFLDRSVGQLGDLAGEPEVHATLLDNVGRVYLNLGMLDEAGGLLEEALAIRRRSAGRDPVAIADSLANVAELRAAQARYGDAEELHREAFTLRRRFLDDDDVRLAKSENTLALVLVARGRLDEAEELLRRALERQRRALGEEHQEVTSAINNLALVLHKKRRREEAAALYRQVIDVNRRRLGEDHPWVAINDNNLALVLCEMGDYGEARSLFERAENLERRVLGERHWSLATTRSNLARCLRMMGDDDTAEELFRAALELQRSELGPDHPNVAESLNNLGRLLYDRGETEQAELAFLEAVEIYHRVPGGPHRDLPRSLNNLAVAVQSRGQLAEAEKLYRDALAMHRDLVGEVNEWVANNLVNLGEVLKSRGELEAAEEPLRQALSTYRQLFGDEHAEVANAHQRLAKLMLAMDRPDRAETHFLEVLRLRRRLLGDRHGDVANALIGLGQALIEQAKAAAAEPRLREAVAILNALPEDRRQPALAVTQGTLGRCLAALGSFGEAESLLKASLAYFEDSLGADHKTTRKARSRLVELYESSGRRGQAEESRRGS